MIVVGVSDDQRAVFEQPLEQGADPRVLAYDHGCLTLRPLEARRRADAELELRLAVRPLAGEARPEQRGRGQDAGLEIPVDAVIDVRQRVAAYAVVTSSRGLLATEFSNRTSVPGRWGLPGGGIDHGEQPTNTVLREVVEETQQTVAVGELLDVQTSHWVGRSPDLRIEDYHAVRLVYAASCPQPTAPVVLDVGGTTESARWVPLDRWDTVAWTAGWRQIVQTYIARGAG